MTDKLLIYSINNSNWMHAWMKQFCNSSDLTDAGLYKLRGFGVAKLMGLFLLLPFSGLRIYEFKKTDLPVPGRDAFYRLLGHPGYNWGKLLYRIACRLIGEFNPLTSRKTPRVWIIDESPYKRSRSKTVQYLGLQYDHSDGTYYRGFRLLVMGWSDGHSFVPCQMELLTNAEAAKRIGPDPNLDRRSCAGKRVGQATRKATELAEEMVARGVGQGLDADYVVVDSWFAQPGVLKRMATHCPVVCRLKDLPKITYRHHGRIYRLQGLYEQARRISRRAKNDPIIASMRVQMVGGPEVRVVFVRDAGNPGKWMALASTDTGLRAEQICRIYAYRWDIEVFFKMIKQHLGLHGLELRNYVSMIAYTSIVLMRYMMLAYYQRLQCDQKTLPGIFREVAKELQAATLVYCLNVLQWEMAEMIFSDPLQPVILIYEKFTSSMQNLAQLIYGNLLVNKPLTINCDS